MVNHLCAGLSHPELQITVETVAIQSSRRTKIFLVKSRSKVLIESWRGEETAQHDLVELSIEVSRAQWEAGET